MRYPVWIDFVGSRSGFFTHGAVRAVHARIEVKWSKKYAQRKWNQESELKFSNCLLLRLDVSSSRRMTDARTVPTHELPKS